MSMTESEALEKLKLEGKLEIGGEPKRLAEFLEALFVAEEALKKLQALERNKTYHLYREYLSIGTVSEFRELKEKATAKKPIYSDFDENENEEIIPYKAVCPVCGHEFEFGTWNDEQNHHCECGQRMLWD